MKFSLPSPLKRLFQADKSTNTQSVDVSGDGNTVDQSIQNYIIADKDSRLREKFWFMFKRVAARLKFSRSQMIPLTMMIGQKFNAYWNIEISLDRVTTIQPSNCWKI